MLGTKSGYAQLDFDNILEEEEDNCKKRFIEMCKRLQKMAKEIERTLPEEILDTIHYETDSFINFNRTRNLDGEPSKSRIIIYYDYEEISRIPEEVICKALEILDGPIKRDFNVDVGDYHIGGFNYSAEQRYQPRKLRSTKRVGIYGRDVSSPMVLIGFVLNIYDKDAKYSQDLYDKLAGAMK